MSANDFQNNNEHSPRINRGERRLSILTSSNPTTDALPVDCILVYNRSDEKDNNHNENHNQNQLFMNPFEQRKKFEDYLVKKQRLILEHVESPSKHFGYIKVHTPFEILLLTAENIRMKLPIEKIDEPEHDTIQAPKTRWHRFMDWCKRPFRLDPSLTKDDIDYYTAIYSSHIDKFKDLFSTLRGSKESYFTPSERSLLTHELLSRAHFDHDDIDNNHQSSGIKHLALNTVSQLKSGSRRPGIHRLIARKAYECYFPLHETLRNDLSNIKDEDLNDREKLTKYWATMSQCLKFQPLSLIRSYMGEKIAFYFALCGFYNQMLIPAALVGLIIFLYGAGSVASDQPTSDICGDFGKQTYMCPVCDKICPFWKLSDSCVYSKVAYVFDNTATLVFGILMSLWARWFVELWKRRQAVLQYDWDSIDFEANLEPIRPDFENKANKIGEERMNPVTGIKEPYISARKRIPVFLIGAAVVILTIAIMCATVFATIVYRVQMTYILQETSVKTYSSIIVTITSALINLICTLILSNLYYYIARKLTNSEIPKYQSQYDDSLTIKIYLFQFVNFYSSLFYIAFFKGRFTGYPSTYGISNTKDFTEQCDPAGCIVELSIQLLIIMTGTQIINILLEFLIIMRRTCLRVCCKGNKNGDVEQWVKDHNSYDFESNTLIEEYLELAIQFGFVTLFVVAFPLAPLFALINNLIEMRMDAWKFLSKYKRPIPFKASDIGIWCSIFSGVSYLAVLTNAIVLAWTSEFVPKMAYRSLDSTGTSLNGYVNWTLSYFPIADYNLTGTMPSDVPNNLTYCRYRDFRQSTGPYSETSTYWNVLAARLAFIVVFEHIVFFIIYLMQWLVPDVPKDIQDKIDHERYIDQRERWASQNNEDNFKQVVITSEAISKMIQRPNVNIKSPINVHDHVKSPTRKSAHRRAQVGISISPEDRQ